MVNQALTGNSDVGGEKGWWNILIGKGKCIDTERFTIICFNIPGNGYDNFLIKNHNDFTTSDIAKLFLSSLKSLKIQRLKMLIGGSIGGAIAWEMLAKEPDLTDIFFL